MSQSTTCRHTAPTPGMPPRFERLRFFSAEAGSEGTAGAGTADAAGQTGAASGVGESSADQGFPKDTPLAEMTAEQQAAYWKTQARKHETRAAAHADYDTVKAELEQLRAQTMTETERAVAEAKAAGKAEAATETLPKLLQAEFRAAAAGRMDSEQLKTATEPLNPTYFLTAKGDEVDTAKVQAFIDGIAPAKGASKTWPDMGQGRREGVKTSAREAGRAAAERRFGKQQQSA